MIGVITPTVLVIVYLSGPGPFSKPEFHDFDNAAGCETAKKIVVDGFRAAVDTNRLIKIECVRKAQ
ncbi:hypothetical protein JXVLWARM_CDS_0093 [Burkholderia phage Bm1]